MARVARLRVYPVKALDGADREAVDVTPGGALAGDREFALFGPDGEPINGKRTALVHRLRTAYDPGTRTLAVHVDDGGANDGGDGARGDGRGGIATRRFDLRGDPGAAEAWFETFFGTPVTIRRDPQRGFADRPDAGPSVVSTATLEAVAAWYDDVTVDGLRRRLRANVEVGGVPAFWEDRFVGEGAPTFVVDGSDGGSDCGSDGAAGGSGSVRFEGVEPCGRCVVPTRDPVTGEPTSGFRERFLERRAASYPEWADAAAFPHDYTLMLIARVPEADRGRTLRVGDAVRVVERGDGGPRSAR